MISRRAHELFISRGGEHGKDVEDWLQAENEVVTLATVIMQEILADPEFEIDPFDLFIRTYIRLTEDDSSYRSLFEAHLHRIPRLIEHLLFEATENVSPLESKRPPAPSMKVRSAEEKAS